MQDDKIHHIAEEALEQLAKALDAGRSEVLEQYLAAQARFHKYSWNNVLLINAQRPTATRVAGYHAWHELGRFVQKGEKGIMIYAPVLVRNRDVTSAATPTQEASRLSGFRSAYVFDVQQTDGRSLPEFAKPTGDPTTFADKLKAIVSEQGITLAYDPTIAPAHGVSSGGHIRLAPGLSPAEEFSVLAHELAHEMLHQGNDEPRLSKTIRETQAEAVAFVVCRGIGLETHTAASDYIALYNGDKTTLAESLAVIHHAATRILNDLIPDERRSVPSRAADALADRDLPAERAAELDPSQGSPSGTGQQPPDPSPSWDR